MRGLLPHLDDAAPAVHGAVQRLLTTLGGLNPTLVRELLEVAILLALPFSLPLLIQTQISSLIRTHDQSSSNPRFAPLSHLSLLIFRAFVSRSSHFETWPSLFRWLSALAVCFLGPCFT